jgi:hypothetical protein
MDQLSNLKLQLAKILPKYPDLRVTHNPNSTNPNFKETAWMVEDFVNQNSQVIEDDDLLKDWLDRYRFWRAGRPKS